MTKITYTDQLTDDLLAPLIKWCQDRPGNPNKKGEGGYAQVLKLYNQGLSQPITHSNLTRWLNPNRCDAVEPKAGALLRLIEVWRQLRGVDTINNAEPTVWCATNGHQSNHSGRVCKRCHLHL